MVEEALYLDLSDELRQVTGVDHFPTDDLHGADEPARPVLRNEDLPELTAAQPLPYREVGEGQMGLRLLFVPVGIGGDGGHGLGVGRFHGQVLRVAYPPVGTVTVLSLLLLFQLAIVDLSPSPLPFALPSLLLSHRQVVAPTEGSLLFERLFGFLFFF